MTSSRQRFVRDAEGLNTAVWPVPVDHLITPTEHFFARSHAPIPVIDPHVIQGDILHDGVGPMAEADLPRSA